MNFLKMFTEDCKYYDLNKIDEIKLINLIDKHKRGSKMIFKEKLYFYVLKLK